MFLILFVKGVYVSPRLEIPTDHRYSPPITVQGIQYQVKK
jgi:hypothetical protein